MKNKQIGYNHQNLSDLMNMAESVKTIQSIPENKKSIL
jgi:hypothetical protein